MALLPVMVPVPVPPRHAEPTGTRMDLAAVAIHTGRARGRAGMVHAEHVDGEDTIVEPGCGQVSSLCCHPSVTEKSIMVLLSLRKLRKVYM